MKYIGIRVPCDGAAAARRHHRAGCSTTFPAERSVRRSRGGTVGITSPGCNRRADNFGRNPCGRAESLNSKENL
jgi:hypothetical protein